MSSSEMQQLKQIEKITGLNSQITGKKLKIYQSDIASFEFLNQMDVNELHIEYCKFVLSGIPSKILKLLINNCNLVDIGALRDLNVQFLDLSQNSIKSIPLQSNKQLSHFNIGANKISKLDALMNLNLVSLTAYDNFISNLSPISFQANLTVLNLRQNKISNIAPLQNLIHLHELHLQNNQIQNLNTLKKLIRLHFLHLSNNQIVDISVLKYLINIQELQLENNKIINAHVLKRNQISVLDLTRNSIIDAEDINEHIGFQMKPNNQQIQNANVLQIINEQYFKIIQLFENRKYLTIKLNEGKIRSVQNVYQMKLNSTRFLENVAQLLTCNSGAEQ
ncbi:leucine-rich_repeat domain-containing protein [Hexamita inflata]|uniref:Leucine-rich repeat domain-containing protein n=1 Tax=Hexamita inflata TaxID=28002 RepID=A0AA86NH35_9EUKA|nr:leucine-rich repeat domain-containing protein [Hexamita inflata]